MGPVNRPWKRNRRGRNAHVDVGRGIRCWCVLVIVTSEQEEKQVRLVLGRHVGTGGDGRYEGIFAGDG